MAGLIRDYVYVGIKGQVLAVDGTTGVERWRTRLRGSEFVTVASDGTRLYASTRGELYCLDGATGRVLWHNRLRGMGWGLASVLPCGASTASNQALSAASVQRAAQGGQAATR